MKKLLKIVFIATMLLSGCSTNSNKQASTKSKYITIKDITFDELQKKYDEGDYFVYVVTHATGCQEHCDNLKEYLKKYEAEGEVVYFLEYTTLTKEQQDKLKDGFIDHPSNKFEGYVPAIYFQKGYEFIGSEEGFMKDFVEYDFKKYFDLKNGIIKNSDSSKEEKTAAPTQSEKTEEVKQETPQPEKTEEVKQETPQPQQEEDPNKYCTYDGDREVIKNICRTGYPTGYKTPYMRPRAWVEEYENGYIDNMVFHGETDRYHLIKTDYLRKGLEQFKDTYCKLRDYGEEGCYGFYLDENNEPHPRKFDN